MTQTPGTPAYMPPEVMVANPKYDTSVDEFSYGILMIHMFSGRWPEPQIGQTRIERGKLIPVTEAERREIFLKVIDNDHPLMTLIHRCINNDPQLRPHAGEIVRRISWISSQFPASFANRLEMLRQIEANREEIRALTEEGQRKDRIIEQRESKMSLLREEIQTKNEQKFADMNKLKLSHSSEAEQLRLQVRDLNTQSEMMKANHAAEVTELNAKAGALKIQIENNVQLLLQEREQSARRLIEEQEQHEIQVAKE
jgi:serine/threonine protein kinase